MNTSSHANRQNSTPCISLWPTAPLDTGETRPMLWAASMAGEREEEEGCLTARCGNVVKNSHDPAHDLSLVGLADLAIVDELLNGA